MNRGWQNGNGNDIDDGDFDEPQDFADDQDQFEEEYEDEPPLGPDKNRRYREAYGDYNGGYGPGGPFKPQRFAPYPGPLGGPGGPPMPPMGPPFRRPPVGPHFRPGFRRSPGPPGPSGPPTGPSFRPGFQRSPGPPAFGGMPGPMGPFALGEGYGPFGPRSFDDLTMRFLTRCGIPEDTLRSLPSPLVAMISPKGCGVCTMELDSYDMARLHYNSKKHKKNVSRWLSVNGFNPVRPTIQREYHPAKEPMKSRDLYCELCDVQITSKVHADSHYAGKSHRAVVEGRKMPKNVSLCQPGMKARMDKLIRREKKFMKAMPPADPVAAAAKDTKPAPPELTCTICKTSVTNTEQMTMHLNGKKHLAKEKQHILRMMTGEQPEDEQYDEVDPEAEEEVKEEPTEEPVEETVEPISAADY